MSVVTPSELASWMNDGVVVTSEMQAVIDAVEEYLLDTYDLPAVWTDRVKTAVKMQAARLLGRRETPQGLALLAEAGIGPVRLTSIDFDVDMLLSRYRKWGFA